MNNCLNSINTSKLDIYILGDWNVNCKNTLSPAYKKLVFFESSNNLKQHIKETTRNTDKSKTLIDLILSNANHISESGTLDTFISDHQPIFIIKKQQRISYDSTEFEGRSYKNLDLDLILDNLCSADWQNLFQSNNPEFAWEQLYQKLGKELDKSCPIRKTRIKNYVPEWISPDLREIMKDRDHYYKKAKCSGEEDDWNIARHLRILAHSSIRQAKADFIKKQLTENAKDGARFWRQLKQIFPTKKSKSNKTKVRLANNTTSVLVPDKEVADYINNKK